MKDFNKLNFITKRLWLISLVSTIALLSLNIIFSINESNRISTSIFSGEHNYYSDFVSRFALIFVFILLFRLILWKQNKVFLEFISLIPLGLGLFQLFVIIRQILVWQNNFLFTQITFYSTILLAATIFGLLITQICLLFLTLKIILAKPNLY
jgi:hypothetical protein